MFSSETEPAPLNSALFLLPFLGIYELAVILSGDRQMQFPFCPLFYPGQFSVIFLTVLFLQQLCYGSGKRADNQSRQLIQVRFLQQYKESLWFGLIPAMLILPACFLSTVFDANTSANESNRLAEFAMQSLAEPAPSDQQSVLPIQLDSNKANFTEQGIQNSKTVSKPIDHHAKISRIAYLALHAGLYEELLFRVILLSGLTGLLLGLKIPKRASFCLSIFLSSLFFAMAHDATPLFEMFEFQLDTGLLRATGLFLYRFCAGFYLAIIYLNRGLGVAVGTHLVYDLTLGYSV